MTSWVFWCQVQQRTRHHLVKRARSEGVHVHAVRECNRAAKDHRKTSHYAHQSRSRHTREGIKNLDDCGAWASSRPNPMVTGPLFFHRTSSALSISPALLPLQVVSNASLTSLQHGTTVIVCRFKMSHGHSLSASQLAAVQAPGRSVQCQRAKSRQVCRELLLDRLFKEFHALVSNACACLCHCREEGRET